MNSQTEAPAEISQPIKRRQFCRHLAVGFVTSMIGGVPCTKWLLADVEAEEPPGQFLLNLAAYPVLANVNGSVVVNLPGAPTGLAQIVVTRAANDEFYAVDSTCAHNQCTVPPSIYNATSLQNEITCSCHGSRYKANGELLGGPALRSLRAFEATLDSSSQLRITIPEFRFSARAAATQPINGARRIKLTFPALSFLTYQVNFRPTLQQAWTPVPFARFFNGALDSTELQGIGRDEEIYVAANFSTGFFSVVTV